MKKYRQGAESPTHLIKTADRAIGNRVTIFKPNYTVMPTNHHGHQMKYTAKKRLPRLMFVI